VFNHLQQVIDDTIALYNAKPKSIKMMLRSKQYKQYLATLTYKEGIISLTIMNKIATKHPQIKPIKLIKEPSQEDYDIWANFLAKSIPKLVVTNPNLGIILNVLTHTER
jgi:hypothetical protein